MKDFALGLALKQRKMGHCGQIDVIIQYGMFGLESQTLVTLVTLVTLELRRHTT